MQEYLSKFTTKQEVEIYQVNGYILYYVGFMEPDFLSHVVSQTQERQNVLHLKNRNKRYLRYGLFEKTMVYGDGANACLMGAAIGEKGLYIFHEYLGVTKRIFEVDLPKDKYKVIVGGGSKEWVSEQINFESHFGSGSVFYFEKPHPYQHSKDYSFMMTIDIKNRMIMSGYYYDCIGYDETWLSGPAI